MACGSQTPWLYSGCLALLSQKFLIYLLNLKMLVLPWSKTNLCWCGLSAFLALLPPCSPLSTRVRRHLVCSICDGKMSVEMEKSHVAFPKPYKQLVTGGNWIQVSWTSRPPSQECLSSWYNSQKQEKTVGKLWWLERSKPWHWGCARKGALPVNRI